MKQTTGYTSSARYKCLEDLQKNSSGLCLTYCGWEYCDPGHRFGPNKRTSCVLHIVKEGKGILEMDKKKSFLAACIGVLMAGIIMSILSIGIFDGILG